MQLDDAGTASATNPQLTHIDVDLHGLDDFRALLARELDANLRPTADGIAADHRQGVGFGARNVGGGVQLARRRYHESLVTSTANLAAYIDASEILIEAIRRIIANYREVDLASAAGSAAVTRELTAAIVAARQAQLDAIEAAQAHAWEQRVGRTEREVGLG
jgi:hypothetical protein